MIQPSEIIPIGTLTRTHGKAGEVQCHTSNAYWDESEAQFIILMTDGIPVPFRVLDWRSKGDDLLFTLQGIDSESKALRVVGSEVYMLRTDVVAQGEHGILTWTDLIGYTINGCTIADIDDTTTNVLAQLQDGRLVPLHEDLIISIDHDQHTIVMNLPQGL